MGSDSNSCKHTQLLLIIEDNRRLRCRHCHLTLSNDELGDGHCPECWEERGQRRYDFEPVEPGVESPVRYRCEACGVMLQPLNG